MDSVVWTPYCGVDGKSHENLIQCSNCHARNPQISHSIPTSISVRKDVVDLSLDSPPRTESAVSVSAAPKFSNYNHEHGAESLRQAHFSQRTSSVRGARRQPSLSSLPAPSAYRVTAIFSLLQYELVDGLPHTIDYKVLGMYDQISGVFLLLIK
jgi:hypothetical protein